MTIYTDATGRKHNATIIRHLADGWVVLSIPHWSVYPIVRLS